MEIIEKPTSFTAIQFKLYPMIRMLFVLLSVMFGSCSKKRDSAPPSVLDGSSPSVNITSSNFVTELGAYNAGEVVKLTGLINNAGTTNVTLHNPSVQIRNISKAGSFISRYSLGSTIEIAAGGTYKAENKTIWTLPADSEAGAYGVYLFYQDSSEKEHYSYLTFFRVTHDKELTVYKIKMESWQGMNIYQLDGGMSAEYAVAKSLENLTGGISHSWNVNAPGSGPNPVMAVPQFLAKSVEQTVNAYNQYLGSSTPVKNVIISTGAPTVPIISNVLGAPVLPVHYLVSSNTVKEIQSIMDYSKDNGFSCYAALGYDWSVPVAVAWIKLLTLPKAYKDFLRQHNVENVYIVGCTERSAGETKAKQVLHNAAGRYANGSIYILYPGNSSNDVQMLQSRLKDFDEVTQESNYSNISDWESGLIPEQIRNYSSTAKEINGKINVYSIASDDLGYLYNFGTYVSLCYFKKNGLVPSGLSINPYLLSHPVYESYKGYVPFSYWQLNPPQSTANNINAAIKKAFQLYFPDVSFNQLSCWVNSSRNFGGEQAARNLITELRAGGFTAIRTNDYKEDEVWNPWNGMNAPCEKIASELSQNKAMFQWNQNLKRMDAEDLIKVSKECPGVNVTVE